MGVNASMMKAASRNPFPAPPENLKMSERESCSSFIILADADFSHDTACDSVLGLASACCPAARERSSAPPNRRASTVRRKTPEINLRRPPVLDLSVPTLARLALSLGHRQVRNGHSLASGGLSTVLDLEGAARATRKTLHLPRSPRPDPQDVPGESWLGCTSHPWGTSQTRHQHR